MSANRKLIVKVDSQTAELWEEGELKKTYLVSTAANGPGCEEGSYCTPLGKLRVAKKIGEGLPLGAVLRSRIPTGEVWSPAIASSASDDLILTRILWLEGAEPSNSNTLGRYIYLHGTHQEHLLGRPVSHGCIRFNNQDIIEVFALLEEGSEVEITEKDPKTE